LVTHAIRGNRLEVFINKGGLVFDSPKPLIVSGISLSNIYSADINVDGKSDLILVGINPSSARVLINKSEGSTLSFEPYNLSTGTNPWTVTMADVNGDTKLDFIVANNVPTGSTPEVNFFINKSTGSSIEFEKVTWNNGDLTRYIQFADFDGDGKPDVAYPVNGSNKVKFFKNNNCFVPRLNKFKPVIICEGLYEVLGSTFISGGTYQWYRNNSIINGASSQFYLTRQAGTYTVEVTSQGGSCKFMSAPITVELIAGGTADIGNVIIIQPEKKEVCPGTEVKLEAKSEFLEYEWKKGSVVKGNTPSILVTEPGIYSLRAKISYNCYAEGTIEIKHLSKPDVKITTSSLIVMPQVDITLTATGAQRYMWSPENLPLNADLTSASQVVKMLLDGEFEFQVTGFDDKGCSSTVIIKIIVADVIELLPGKLITPNGDGYYDTWEIKNIEGITEDCVVSIYSPQGKLVFEAKKPKFYQNGGNISFSGKDLNGNDLVEGAYFYTITCENKEKNIDIKKKGTVTLLR
jgi:gliding motility-associated-like protein